jgi:curved DNA-binding protein CbpA
MAEKPDYYEVLGVEKKASEDEIKKAHKKIMMRCHPDALRGKPDAERAAAEARYKLANEAKDVLLDPARRPTYDSYGHQGLENLAAGRSAGTGQSWTEAAGEGPKLRQYTESDIFDFFDKKSGTSAASADRPAASTRRVTPEERRARREAERRGEPVPETPVTPPPSAQRPAETPRPAARPPAPASDAFRDTVDKVRGVADKLRVANDTDVIIPAGALKAFRENLQDFMEELDNAIDRAKRYKGPSF